MAKDQSTTAGDQVEQVIVLRALIDNLRRGFMKNIQSAEEEILRLSSLLDQARLSIIVTNLDGNIEYVNPYFEEATGYTSEEVVGKNPRILKSGKQDESVYDEMWETIRRGDVWKGRFINKRKDGSLYTEDVTIFPVKSAEGRIVNYAAVKSDVTAMIEVESALEMSRKRLMEAVVENKRELEQISHAFSQFLPTNLEPAGGLEFTTLHKPAEDFAGNFYLVEPMVDGRVSLALVDVAGRGAAATLLATTARALLCAAISQLNPGEGPRQLLAQFRRWMEAQLANEQFVSVWIGIWDPVTGNLRHVSAGHAFPLVIEGRGAARQISGEHAVPIGLGDEPADQTGENEIRLRPGMQLLLYAKGWLRGREASGETFDEKELLARVMEACDPDSPEWTKQLLAFFQEGVDNSNADDLTLLLVTRRV